MSETYHRILRKAMNNILRKNIEDIVDQDIYSFWDNNLFWVLNSCDSFKLYRYIKADYHNIRNIETQTIHLSDNGVMNDVFEGLPQLDGALPYSKIEKLNDLAKMTCFTEDNDIELMWSHYADSHKGVCVEYDIKRLKDDPYCLVKHLYPIVYGDERKIWFDYAKLVDSHISLKESIRGNYYYDGILEMDDLLPMFVTKSSSWEKEKEWRIVFTLKQMYDVNDPKLYDGNLKFECISAIYLGYRIEPMVKEHLIEICKRIEEASGPVKVFQARLDNENYNIHFDEIKK